MTDTLKPTDEQQQALDHFAAGDSLAIQALAGAGKSESLCMIARSTNRSCQFVAFNKQIVSDIGARLPSNANARTMHSLAFRAVGRKFAHRLNSERVSSERLARTLGVGPFNYTAQDSEQVLQPARLASLAIQSAKNFCYSGDDEPAEHHVPYMEGVDWPDPVTGKRGWDNNRRLRTHLLPTVRKVWEDWQNVGGSLPYNHDAYAKLWERSEPVIDASIILYDECFPAGTTIETHLGPMPIEKLAERPDEPWQVLSSSDGGRTLQWSYVTSAYRTPCRGPLVRFSGTWGELVCTANHPVWVQDEGWVPAGLVWRGAHVRVVPRATRQGGQQRDVLAILRSTTRSLTSGPSGGTSSTGEDLSADEGRSHRDSEPDARSSHQGEGVGHDASEGSSTLGAWREREGSDRSRGGTVRSVERDLRAWALVPRVCRTHWAKTSEGDGRPTVSLQNRLGVPIAADSSRGGRGFPQLSEPSRTGSAQDGGAEWARVDRVEIQEPRSVRGPGSGSTDDSFVYTLAVADTHCYFADGVLVKNCQDANGQAISILMQQTDAQLVVVGDRFQQLYAWRASVNSFDHFTLDATTHLTKSWRFGPAIAEVGNLMLDRLGSDIHIVGNDAVQSTVEAVATPACELFRTNAGAVEALLAHQAAGTSVHLVGSAGQEVVRFARAQQELQQRGHTSHPDLACFSSWGQVLEYVQFDPLGSELKLMVKLVERYGAEAIIRALDRMPSEEDAQVITATAHSGKGRQWSTVRLGGDFAIPAEDAEGEVRLLYVAVTRPQLTLDVTLCEPVLSIIEGAAKRQAAAEPPAEVIVADGLVDGTIQPKPALEPKACPICGSTTAYRPKTGLIGVHRCEPTG